MSASKPLKIVANASKYTAVKQAGILSRCFAHQPKVPTKLLEKHTK